MMNNTILAYLRKILAATSGNYFELGSSGGEMISVLSLDYPNKVFISVDSDSENYNTVIKNTFDHANVLFYSMTAKEYNQTLTDSVAQAHGISVIFINHGMDYEDYAETIRIAQRLLGTKSGSIVINNVNEIPDILAELDSLLGHRFTNQVEIVPAVRAYQIREQ